MVDVYSEKSVGCSPERRGHVAGAASRLLVEPAAAFVRGMESGSRQHGGDGESFKGEADEVPAEAKSRFVQAMLNQVQSDAVGARWTARMWAQSCRSA